MRDGWTETTLNQVLLSVLTRAKDNLDYEVLSVTERRGIIPQTEVFNHRIATDDISKYKVLQPGDIAFNPYLLWCGAIGQWKGNYEGVVSPVYECFRVRDTDSPRFVGLIFESGVLTPYFDSTAIGSIVRRRRTTLPVFYEAPIFRPPLEEQKRIVDVVSSVDAYIAALQQQVDSARTARNAVLHELFTAGGDDWTESTLGDISVFVSRRELPKGLALDTPYVGLEHVEPKTTLISTWGNVKSVSSSVTPFEPEDTLFGRLRPYLHKVAFADFPGVCSPEILVLRSSSKCMPKFLYLLCSLDSTVKKCVDMSAGTRMPRTSTTDLASIEIQLPPLDEQKRIVEIVSSMADVIQSTEQAVTDAKNLRSGLLPDLLSGNHEIPASYDSLLGAA